MKTRHLLVAIALVGAGVAIGWIAAPGGVAAADGSLTAQDYAEIEQLYWRYNHAADFRDGEQFVSVFADDAEFSTGQQTYRGKEELLAWRVERHAGQTGDSRRRHWNNGWRILPTADGAEARVYWILVDVSGGQPNTVASGYYDDTYVKTADGWRIRSRKANSDRSM